MLEQKKNNIVDKWMRILIYFQFIYLLVFDGFFLSIPILSKLHYLTDIVTLMLLLGIIFDWKKLLKIHGWVYYLPMFAYVLVCIISVIINYVKPMLFLWASRNTFRFFIFFFACILYLNHDDVLNIFDKLLKLQFINFPLAIIEFLYFYFLPYGAIDIPSDHVGGIFGIETGCNGRLNIYLCLVLIVCLVDIYEREKFKFLHIFVISTSMLCAALAELKAFFPEAVGILVIISILYIKKLFYRRLLFVKVIVLFAISFALGIVLMFQIYPHSSKVYSDYSYYEKKSSVTYQLGRFGAFSKINEIFFSDSQTKRLFGFGFGNCEYSSFSMFTSDFYREYSYYHYRWFAHQMLYLETGLAGFATFSLFIVTIALQSFVMFLKSKRNRTIAAISVAFAAVVFVTLWYNCTIRTDFGYICYFFLAAVPVLQNERKDKLCSQ